MCSDNSNLRELPCFVAKKNKKNAVKIKLYPPSVEWRLIFILQINGKHRYIPSLQYRKVEIVKKKRDSQQHGTLFFASGTPGAEMPSPYPLTLAFGTKESVTSFIGKLASTSDLCAKLPEGASPRDGLSHFALSTAAIWSDLLAS